MADQEIALIPLGEVETVKLVRLLPSGTPLDLAFGTGGVALRWDTSKPMSEAVRLLGLMRGVSNQNMDGAGI